MINFVFKNRKGVTILEGLIAMGLLAIVAVGVLGVVLSITRKSNEPSVREEVAFAVEKARDALQLYAAIPDADVGTVDVANLPQPLPAGICGGDPTPLSTGVNHNIPCMLPPVCDPATSSFTYNVQLQPNPWTDQNSWNNSGSDSPYAMNADMETFFGITENNIYNPDLNLARGKVITFMVECNGYKL